MKKLYDRIVRWLDSRTIRLYTTKIADGISHERRWYLEVGLICVGMYEESRRKTEPPEEWNSRLSPYCAVGIRPLYWRFGNVVEMYDGAHLVAISFGPFHIYWCS